MIDKVQKVFLQFLPRAMDALLQSAPGQDAKEAFGQVDPGGVRGGVVKVNLGMTTEPALGGSALVDVQVVQDHVQFALREMPNHLVHETQEVDGGPALHFAQNFPGGNLQGRRQQGQLLRRPQAGFGPSCRCKINSCWRRSRIPRSWSRESKMDASE